MQRDSSCSGEVISRTFDNENDDGHWQSVISRLADAAVDVDAEPGWSAGFHVHVGNGPQQKQRRARAFYAYLMWERAFEQLAAGRFSEQRDCNRSVGYDLRPFINDNYYRPDNVPAPTYIGYSCSEIVDWSAYRQLADEDFRTLANWTYDRHRENDRHSNLNLGTHHGGFEFRLWNSTRAAWRMELFVRLSLAFAHRGFVNHLLDTRPSGSLDDNGIGHDATEIANALSAAGDTTAVALLMRQVHYLHHRAQDAPNQLTLV